MGFFDRLKQVLGEKTPSPVINNEPIPQVVIPEVKRSDSDVWNKAIEFVLAMEGGYVNDASDPGGKTKYGISQRAYPHLDIERLTVDDAKTIYLRDYWLGTGAKVASVSEPLAIIMFDTAVNMGSPTAIRMLQRVLHIREDGVFGPMTKEALENADINYVIDWFVANRILRYAELEGWSRYRRGWISRVAQLMRHAYNG